VHPLVGLPDGRRQKRRTAARRASGRTDSALAIEIRAGRLNPRATSVDLADDVAAEFAYQVIAHGHGQILGGARPGGPQQAQEAIEYPAAAAL
jgi:hypothetical protein